MASGELTIDELIELLTKFKKDHEGDERLSLPVTVNQYDYYRRAYGIEFVDVTDGCSRCDNEWCAYGGPKANEAPADDKEAEAAGYKFELLHWVLELKYHEVD